MDLLLTDKINTYCELVVTANKPVDFEVVPREVSTAIANLKWKSSCGKDDIPTKFIKNLSCSLIFPMVLLFNQMLALFVVPTALRLV